MSLILRYAKTFASARGTDLRLGTNTGGMLVSTPNGSRVLAVIGNMGSSGLANDRAIMDTSDYAAGYLTPLLGVVRSGFNVRGKFVDAMRTCATSRGTVSGVRGGNVDSQENQTDTRGVIPASAKTTGSVNLIVPDLGNGLSNVTCHIPAVSNSVVSMALRLGFPIAGRLVGRAVGGGRGSTVGCARSPVMSDSMVNGGENYTFSSLLAGVVRIRKGRLIGLIN